MRFFLARGGIGSKSLDMTASNLTKEIKALASIAKKLDLMREGFISCTDEGFDLEQTRFEGMVETSAKSFKVSTDEIMSKVNELLEA